MGAINLDTCDAVEHRIFSVDLDEEEEDGCGRCAKPRSLRFCKLLWARCLRPWERRRPWPAALALATVRSGSAGSGLSRGVMAPVVPTLRDRVPVHAPEDRGTQPRGDGGLSRGVTAPGCAHRNLVTAPALPDRAGPWCCVTVQACSVGDCAPRPDGVDTPALRSYLRPDPSASRLGPGPSPLNALRVNAARSVVFQAAGSMEANRRSRAWLRARAASLSLMAAATASSWSKEVPSLRQAAALGNDLSFSQGVMTLAWG